MTYIRRLEIRGFKSSGHRPVVVNFEKGFTVITGPNGSGKSNLADAILFAIGENSPKSLRSGNGRLSGLIYEPKEGTPDSGRSSGCRVSLQFDNVGRSIPVDSDLVTVTRELRDDGENFYYINGRRSTRGAFTDVLDLAGLSAGDYNIVQQNSALRMAEFTPEEKRRAIEETVGIAKFDEKKAEAQRQLSQADQRLEVAMARIGEMKSTLELLDSQRNDMLRYNFLETQINWLTAVGTSKRIGEMKERLSSLQAQEAELSRRVGDLNARVAELENKIGLVESEKTRFIVDVVQGGGSSHVELQLQLADVKNELATMEADLKEAEGAVAELEEETVPQLRQVVSTKQKEVNAANSSIRQLTTEIAKLDEKHLEMSTRLKEYVKAGDELRDTMEKKGRQNARIQVKLVELGQKASQADLAINAANASLGAERKRLDELKLRVDGYSDVLQKLEENTKQLFEVYESSNKDLSSLDFNLSGVEKTRERLVASIATASKTLEKASAEVSKEEAYRHVSESLAGERAGQLKLQEYCEGGGVAGYVGRLGQLVKYQQAHSKPINAVMGKWMGAFVVQDVKAMTKLIKAAKTLKAKSYSVIPLSEVEEAKAVSARRTPGVLGSLSSFVKCDEEFEGLVNFLVGDTILVDSEAAAYMEATDGVRAVTLEGEVFEPGGRAYTFGYQEVLMNLVEGLENIEGISEVEDAVGALRGALQRRKTELESLDTESRSLTKERVKKIVSSTSLKAEATTITRMANRYKSIFRTMSSEYQKQAVVVSRLESKLKLNTERKDSISRGTESLQNVLAEYQSLGLEQHLAELEASKQSLSSEIDGVRNRISDLNLSLAREKGNLENFLTRGLDENQLDLENALENLQAYKQIARDTPKRVREMTEQRDDLDRQIQKILESSKRSQPVLDEFDTRARRLKEERDAVTRSVAGTQKDLIVLTGQVAGLQDKVEEALGSLRMLGYSQELEPFDSSDALLADLEREYSEVAGSVNRGADRQYNDMYLNYKNLSVRHNELERERNAIVTFIQKVDADKRQAFMGAFEKVGSEFSGIFTRLTEREAYLELENPDEPFAGGVFLRADFGNGFRESAQHSGGQKAVTGVSLILAMQAVQSHPFYLFDEIDAALDAVNSSSLARFFREKSSEAQIIAITLRDVFVAESSITYGVYSAGGVSRVVHYKPAEVQTNA